MFLFYHTFYINYTSNLKQIAKHNIKLPKIENLPRNTSKCLRNNVGSFVLAMIYRKLKGNSLKNMRQKFIGAEQNDIERSL